MSNFITSIKYNWHQRVNKFELCSLILYQSSKYIYIQTRKNKNAKPKPLPGVAGDGYILFEAQQRPPATETASAEPTMLN